MDRPTLEQLAQTTEPQMVRRRFDEQNLVWAYVISWFFAVTSFVLVGLSLSAKTERTTHIPLSLCDAALTVFMIAAMTELRRARRRENWKPHAYARLVRANLAGWVIVVVIFKFATLTFFALSGGGWIFWGVAFPIATLALRLLLPQRVALNLMMLAIVLAALFFVPEARLKRNTTGILIALSLVNAGSFAGGALGSRNARRTALEEGVQRRSEVREQLRIRDELRFAREVQISMLPEAPPKLDWADVTGISLPATEVGGDYYDYYIVDGRLAVICGDVAGHGLASGITLSALRSGFTLLRDALLDPAHVLERLQEVVTQSSRRRMMVTISVLLLDPETQRATIASAGHPPLLQIRAGVPQFVELHSLPLGARLGEHVPQEVVPFASGDIFVLHSDGIYETVNARGETYGLERLGRVAAACDGSAEQIRDEVLRDVDTFRGTEAQLDDVTLVVVKIG